MSMVVAFKKCTKIIKAIQISLRLAIWPQGLHKKFCKQIKSLISTSSLLGFGAKALSNASLTKVPKPLTLLIQYKRLASFE
jgi:hypothetical protein